MAVCTTEMPVMTDMIEAMPAMIPTIVRNDLSLWVRIADNAILNASRKNTFDLCSLFHRPAAIEHPAPASKIIHTAARQ
jgi:hypothetical protein